MSFVFKTRPPQLAAGPYVLSHLEALPRNPTQGWLSAPLRYLSRPVWLLGCDLLRDLPGASKEPSLRDRQARVQKTLSPLILVGGSVKFIKFVCN